MSVEPSASHAVWAAPDTHTQHLDSLEFSLAAFLVAAGEYHYFVYGPANSWRLRNGAGRDFVFYAEFKRRLGSPTGVAVRNGTQFARKFAHAHVWCDVAARTADITWL